jgi:hypothetical protein
MFNRFLLSLLAIAQCIALTAADTAKLSEQMKSFKGRIAAYAKCIRGKCSPDERSIIAKAALKDGALLL